MLGATEQANKPAFPSRGEDSGDKVPRGVGLPHEGQSLAEAMRPFNLQDVN